MINLTKVERKRRQPSAARGNSALHELSSYVHDNHVHPVGVTVQQASDAMHAKRLCRKGGQTTDDRTTPHIERDVSPGASPTDLDLRFRDLRDPLSRRRLQHALSEIEHARASKRSRSVPSQSTSHPASTQQENCVDLLDASDASDDQRMYPDTALPLSAGEWLWERRRRDLPEGFLNELSKQHPPDSVLFRRDDSTLRLTETERLTHAERAARGIRQAALHKGLTSLYPEIWVGSELIGILLSFLVQAHGAQYAGFDRPPGATTKVMDVQAMQALQDKRGHRVRWPTGMSRVIFPINIGNQHWVTGVVDREARRIHIEDPLHVTRTDLGHILREWASHHTSTTLAEWTVTHQEVKRQINDNDCGIFMLADILCLLEGRDP
eukprot:CAMPEP_0181300566 /NCGR_PEP_ID=MMETSP1101-20121128/6957_1 /TAXON_ID=46948 /ORGANISM="Rhodomonas abbreviata, Strain Caron Lab Isolate" /LENGTH=380 /DNA_ID=CAMNT_0023405809 /DNA_START=300 /DNA_END=1439 /DNA_ORIENTATION=+